MKKTFLLDTNILLTDPDSIFAFEDNDVVIPIICIEEIDKFKREQTERGRSARALSRNLDQLRKKQNRSLSEWVDLGEGGRLRVELGWDAIAHYPYRLGEMTNDDRILAVALDLKNQLTQSPLIFLSRDTNLRIKADAMGISADDYISDHINFDELYPGIREHSVDAGIIDKFYQNKEMDLFSEELYSNEFVLLKDKINQAHTGLGRVNPERNKIVTCCQGSQQIWGITPKNLEQRIAFELLTDDRLSLVTLVGRAGTGKTLLALAAGLSKSIDEHKYRKLLVSRPIFPMGKDLGYLPGEISDKLKPWIYRFMTTWKCCWTVVKSKKLRQNIELAHMILSNKECWKSKH
jgi:PhoH-like ATPase